MSAPRKKVSCFKEVKKTMTPPSAYILAKRYEFLQEQAEWCREYMRINRMMASIQDELVEVLREDCV